MDLEALTLFHLVATNGGFGRAARATNRSKATLSRRVGALEQSLGVRLFERGGGCLRLTEDGRSLIANTQGPLDDIAATESSIRGRSTKLQGRLRVSVPLLFGQMVMGELAARFREAHPLARLEVVTHDRYVDLIQEGFDIAIRANPQPNDDLVGRCFMRDVLLVVASAHLKRPHTFDVQGELPIPAVVRTIGDDGGPWIVQDQGHQFRFKPEPVLSLSTLSMRDAVAAGAGAALLPRYFVRDDLASGRLVSWGKLVDHPLEHWLLHSSARLASNKIRVFMQFVLDAFSGKGVEA